MKQLSYCAVPVQSIPLGSADLADLNSTLSRHTFYLLAHNDDLRKIDPILKPS